MSESYFELPSNNEDHESVTIRDFSKDEFFCLQFVFKYPQFTTVVI